MTKCKDTGVLISIIAGSEIIFSEVEEIATDLLTGYVDIRLKDGTGIHTIEGSKLHQALVRELENADLTKRIERIVDEKLAGIADVCARVVFTSICSFCSYGCRSHHVPRDGWRCPECKEDMKIVSVEMIGEK